MNDTIGIRDSNQRICDIELYLEVGQVHGHLIAESDI